MKNLTAITYFMVAPEGWRVERDYQITVVWLAVIMASVSLAQCSSHSNRLDSYEGLPVLTER